MEEWRRKQKKKAPRHKPVPTKRKKRSRGAQDVFIDRYFKDNVFHITPGVLAESLPSRQGERDIGQHESASRQLLPDTFTQRHTNQIFNKACLEGNNNRVKQLISKGEVDINNVRSGGWTPVMTAVSKGHKPVFNTLLKEKCDLSVILDNGDDILHVACSGSNADIVKTLVSNGDISLERKDLSGRTPLMKAARSGNKKTFDLLVNEDCNLSATDYSGNNMLHAACSGGSVHIVNFLLKQKGADIESRGEDGRTPVMVAAINGQKQVFDLLVKKGCNLSVVDDLGDTVLHAACCSESVHIVTYLLSNEIVDIESRSESGLTPVMCAVFEGQSEVFDALVSHGCDLSVVDDGGENILHAACYSDNVKIVRYILSRKLVDINSKDDNGDTPLMVAAREGNRKVFDLLVSNDCDSLVVSDFGNILHAACLSGSTVLVKDILLRGIVDNECGDEYGATPVMLAAKAGQRKIFDLLVGEGCSLTVKDDFGYTILHAACCSDNVEIVEYILSLKLVHINSRESKGLTPVMIAARKGRKKVYDLLAGKGCDLSVVDYEKNNILHAACAGGNVNIVNCILSCGITDTESRGEDGQTPVMMAAANGHRKVFSLLVQRGCDLSLKDDDLNTILHVGSRGGDVQIVEYLLSCKYLLSRKIIDIDSVNDADNTPAMIAALNGQQRVFDLLVKKERDLKVLDKHINNILHAASCGGSVQIVESILSRKVADKESRGEDGQTPVICAAVNGHRKVFELLVQKGCDLSVKDDDGNNILHVASYGGSVQIVESILSRKLADKESRGVDGQTPVICAAVNGHRKVFELLVQKGCDLSVKDDDGNNILHAGSEGGDIHIVQYLLSHNIIDIDSVNDTGLTPVMIAAQNGKKEAFDLLVENECDLRGLDGDNSNILHAASRGGSVQVVESILSRTLADKESRAEDGFTPVMMAAVYGHRKVFELLVQKGCDLSVKDDDGNNILHVASYGGSVQIVESILSRNFADKESRSEDGKTPVICAAVFGQRKVFELLVQKGCDLSVKDGDGNNILHAGSKGGDVHIVQYLLSHNICCIDSVNNRGLTPVMIAARNGKREAFDLLVENACDLKVLDGDNSNILHAASCGGSVQIVESILSRKVADKESRGECGQTPVMLAAESGHWKVFNLLVRKDCNLSVVDDSGRNILHCACVGNNVQIVEYIISQDADHLNRKDKNGQTPVMVAKRKVICLLERV